MELPVELIRGGALVQDCWAAGETAAEPLLPDKFVENRLAGMNITQTSALLLRSPNGRRLARDAGWFHPALFHVCL